MKVERTAAGAVIFRDLDPILMDLLRRVPEAADPGDSAEARDRLLPDPAPGEPELAAEWREYVRPDLRHIFQSAVETLAGDVAAAGPASVQVPEAHIERWLNALNQARLALYARHRVSDEEMEELDADLHSERGMALFQIHFYAVLQEILLHREDE